MIALHLPVSLMGVKIKYLFQLSIILQDLYYWYHRLYDQEQVWKFADGAKLWEQQMHSDGGEICSFVRLRLIES